MSGLTEKGGGEVPDRKKSVQDAHEAWQASMERQIEILREHLREQDIQDITALCGGEMVDNQALIRYWRDPILITWPQLNAINESTEEPCSTFDTAMLLYYLDTADGTPMSDRWIGFRELPDGTFYNQAFQGYSGGRLAGRFGEDPEGYLQACQIVGGVRLPALAPHAFAFSPLPRVRLASVMWPGDDEFATRASILFDAASNHYLPTDGLALLGSGLARRLIRAAERI